VPHLGEQHRTTEQNQKESPELEAFLGSGLSLLFLFSAAAALLLQIGHREEPLYLLLPQEG
jgi:hypothetical protein